MRILIINTDYSPFLRGFYEGHPGLSKAPYAVQLEKRNESLFGVADFYSRNFIAAGHEAWEVHANNPIIQTAWLKKQNLPVPAERKIPALLQRAGKRILRDLGLKDPFRPSPLHPAVELDDFSLDLEETLILQARLLRPDVVLNQSVSEVDCRVLERIRPFASLIVGQIASPLPEDETYRCYDLMVSSLPNLVAQFRQRGIPAELNRLGFEPSVLNRFLPPPARDIPLSFVGSVTPDHAHRYQILEKLARETDIQIWGRVSVSEHSSVLQKYEGEAWGYDMLRILGRSQITVNQHIDIAEQYANNLRLYEATAMGALLLTDWKENIRDMFEPGVEVVCYRDTDECIALIRHYLEQPEERAAIAAAGQRRTLAEHTFRRRTQELSELFEANLETARRNHSNERKPL